jgi:hypothetical protein
MNATKQGSVQLPLPVPIGQPQTFTVKGQTYEILRFKGKGPTLAQTITIAESMQGKQMLTLKEAREIRDDSESNAAFRNAINPGEWGYVRDPEAEERSSAAFLVHYSADRRLYAIYDYRPDDASRVVILKVDSKAPAPQEVAGELRKEEQKQCKKMNATATRQHGSITLRAAIRKAAPIAGALAVNVATSSYLLRTDSPSEVFQVVAGAIGIVSAVAAGSFATPVNWIGSTKGHLIRDGVAATVIAGDTIAVLLRMAN